MSYNLVEIKFCKTWYNNVTYTIAFNENDSALKLVNRNIFYNHDEIYKVLLWLLHMHRKVILWDTSLVQLIPNIETKYH